MSDLRETGGFTLKCKPPAVATPLEMVFDSTGIALNSGTASIKLTDAGIEVTATTGPVTINGVTVVVPSLAVEGNVTVTGAADVSGAVSIAGGLTVQGGGTVDGAPIL